MMLKWLVVEKIWEEFKEKMWNIYEGRMSEKNMGR